MAAPTLDTQFMQLWSKLTIVQKESLLRVIQSFVEPVEHIGKEEYNKEIDEAVARAAAGDFYTQEEVEKLSKEW